MKLLASRYQRTQGARMGDDPGKFSLVWRRGVPWVVPPNNDVESTKKQNSSGWRDLLSPLNFVMVFLAILGVIFAALSLVIP